MPDANHNHQDMDLLLQLASEAGAIAMNWFGKDPEVWMKEGQSPVSEADFAVDNFLKEKLLEARPDYGWLSEETEDTDLRLEARRTFVVDPIDGTRGFIQGLKQWCVSIAVVENGRPVAGILECPALGQTISAIKGKGTTLNGAAITTQQTSRDSGAVRVTGPRNLQNSVALDHHGGVEKTPFVPSLAYRLAMVAMGEVDLALARASAKDWDLAAADLIVHEAGAMLSNLEGNPLVYNCRDVRHGALVGCAVPRRNEMLDLARLAINKQD